MDALETYLRDLRDTHASGGVAETSYYPALRALLNEVGARLKPKVLCTIHPKSIGAGLPDGGLYTPDQIPKGADEPIAGTPPSRGAIEAKPIADDLRKLAKSAQVAKYLKSYGQVLLSNFREFALVAEDEDGAPRVFESYSLAPSEAEFWNAAAHPQTMAKMHGESIGDFLMRVMLHPAGVAEPKVLAWFLASYARQARRRVENRKLPALEAVREALEQALGIKFEGDKGEHFFRSTLVQTLFYGVFAAWVLWARERRRGKGEKTFDWRLAEHYLQVPIVAALFHEVSAVNKLKALAVDEVLDWAGNVLNRVELETFFAAFEEEHAVQYFYEPFLHAYDPELRKQLGVWYTPREVATYMVERVDAVLRSELEIPDGLADPRVYILDPCCGTGSYLVEVLRRIHKTLSAKGANALTAHQVKQAALGRVFGFEIMPAPFVIAHLQIGLALQRLEAPLETGSEERAAIYLTNALTGWEPPTGPKQDILALPELEAERDAAADVKQDKPILVILGNPPYNAFDGVSPEEEGASVELYKSGLAAEWKIKKFNLDDLYVRFFRVAERRVVEGKPHRGIVAFISNFSYLGDPSFVVMRKRFIDEFDRIWIDCMNGDSRETGKLTPEGRPDPSVFSTDYNREGIRVGTAVGIFVRKQQHAAPAAVSFRQFWGAAKRADLMGSLKASEFDAQYRAAEPAPINRYSFRPSIVAAHYLQWPRIPDLALRHFNGPVERRGLALISIERESLRKRIRAYFDADISDEEVRTIFPSLMMTGNRIVGPKARREILSRFKFDETRIARYPVKPFDTRWCYLENLRPLFSEPSPELLAQRNVNGNAFFITRDTADKSPEGAPFFYSELVSDYDSISGHARHFPLWLKPNSGGRALKSAGQKSFLSSAQDERAIPNLSEPAIAFARLLGFVDPQPKTIWMHALAIGYSPAYLTENADGIRQDWPRIPLPDSKDLLLASAELGREIAALLDTEAEVRGVTSGELRPELKEIGVIMRDGGGALFPEQGDLALTAGWGHGGKGGIVMPGKGRIVARDYLEAEAAAMKAGAAALGLAPAQIRGLLGSHTCDVYLNGIAYWRNVPIRVWEYTIGGYQVIKKWLSYRERNLLGRDLSTDEVNEVGNIARRIAAILLLEPALDSNYRAVAAATYPWPAP